MIEPNLSLRLRCVARCVKKNDIHKMRTCLLYEEGEGLSLLCQGMIQIPDDHGSS